MTDLLAGSAGARQISASCMQWGCSMAGLEGRSSWWMWSTCYLHCPGLEWWSAAKDWVVEQLWTGGRLKLQCDHSGLHAECPTRMLCTLQGSLRDRLSKQQASSYCSPSNTSPGSTLT